MLCVGGDNTINRHLLSTHLLHNILRFWVGEPEVVRN